MWRIGGIDLLILNLGIIWGGGIGQLHALTALSKDKYPLLSIEQEAGLAPEPAKTL